jgi:thiol-disulfide isomerase/thioredoxin
MKIFRFRSALAGAVLVAAGAFPSAGLRAAADQAPVPLGPAPAWHLKDLDGHDVSSADFKGKVVVVDFWAVWCGPCKSEMPGYVALQKKYGPDGLVIIGVVYDREAPAAVRKFVSQYLIGYQIVLGTDEMENAFGGMDAIPTTFIIDRDGIIRERKVGTMPTAEFEKHLLRYLKPSDLKD